MDPRHMAGTRRRLCSQGRPAFPGFLGWCWGHTLPFARRDNRVYKVSSMTGFGVGVATLFTNGTTVWQKADAYLQNATRC